MTNNCESLRLLSIAMTRASSVAVADQGADQAPVSTGTPLLDAPVGESVAAPGPSCEAIEVIEFWRQAGPALWFAKNDDFDRRFCNRFLSLHEAAARGELTSWAKTADGTLALIILLDQFPRNAFRGTSRTYATDAMARNLTNAALAAGFDHRMQPELQRFVYLPFGHSELLRDQERSVQLCRRLADADLAHAVRHHDIIRRFGRFPHRNAILGRVSTPLEQRYLDDGGYAG